MSTENSINDFIVTQLNSTPLTVWLADENGKVLFVNGATEKVLNSTKHEIQNTYMSEWMDQISLEKVDTLLLTAEDEEVIETELNLFNKKYEQHSYYAFVKAIPSAQRLYCFVPISTEYFQVTEQLMEINADFSNLYSELYKKNRIIEQQKQDYYLLSVTDALTKLFNRRYFYDIVEDEIEASEKNGYPLSFLMIDINNFKKVNDLYGHHAGDELLVSITGLILEKIEKEEKAFRFGGDEFLIVLHRSWERSLEWASNMSDIFRDLNSIATLSYGAVEYNGNSKDVPALLIEADRHMYERKTRIKELNQEGRGKS